MPAIQTAEYISTGEQGRIIHTSWKRSCRAVLPIYLSTHLAFFLLTYLAPLFLLPDFSNDSLPITQLLQLWNRWDTGNFTTIATIGYIPPDLTAFFPLYPLLIRALMYLGINSLLAGLLISNMAGFAMLVVLHRLVLEDFGRTMAERTILFLSIFPTAFFFAAAYNETLFLSLILLSFSSMRQRQFWLAGTFGLLASLTRSAGVLLFVPFVYEYVRRGQSRLDAAAIVLIPVGTLLFALYCNWLFADPLAFMHAQANWQRHLDWPWTGMWVSLRAIRHRPALSFYSLHNVIDLGAGVFVGGLVFLSFVGPYRFKPHQRAYALFGLVLLLFPLLVPAGEPLPLASLSRLVLEVFPAFIVLARMTVKYPRLERGATIIFVALLSFILLQFVTGHWVV